MKLLYFQELRVVPGIVHKNNSFRDRLIEYLRTDNSFKEVQVAPSFIDLQRNVILVKVVNVGNKMSYKGK